MGHKGLEEVEEKAQEAVRGLNEAVEDLSADRKGAVLIIGL